MGCAVRSRRSESSSESGQSSCYASDNNLASWAYGTSQTHRIEFVQAAFPQGPLLTPWQWLMGNAHASASFSSGAESHLKTLCRVENLPDRGSVVFRISCSSLNIYHSTSALLSCKRNPRKHTGMWRDKFHVACWDNVYTIRAWRFDIIAHMFSPPPPLPLFDFVIQPGIILTNIYADEDYSGEISQASSWWSICVRQPDTKLIAVIRLLLPSGWYTMNALAIGYQRITE